MMSSMGKARTLVCFLVAYLASCAHASVVTLNDDNFEHQTQASTGQTTGKWFIMFYAEWCGHCKRLKPVWEELSDAFDADAGTIVAQVDAIENRETAERFSVQSFPTLIYLADRKMYKYKGPRTIEDLKDFCTSSYQESEAFAVPSMPGFVEIQRRKIQKFVESNEQLQMLMEDFDHIVEIRKNAAAVLVLMGALVGFLFGCCVVGSMSGSNKQTKKKTKTD